MLQPDPQNGLQPQAVMEPSSGGGRLVSAVITVDSRVTNSTAMTKAMAHEIGHTFGLGHCANNSICNSVMSGYNGDFNDITSGSVSPYLCGIDVAKQFYTACATPTPNPSPTPTPAASTQQECQNIGWYWNFSNNTCYDPGSGGECDLAICDPDANPYLDQTLERGCCYNTPLLIDTAGDGFSLTDAAHGVDFDLRPDGTPERISWTRAGSDDAWLALDRNGNSTIDNGRELFGNFTTQSRTTELPNGFLALAEFDKVGQGGNGDGVIDGGDAIFASLRLWLDINHNGISEPAELHTLSSLNVARLHLEFKESKKVDQYGNLFRYRAKIDDAKRAQVGRWAWDVFLVKQRGDSP